MDTDQIKEIAAPILKRYGIAFAGLFGSYARNEADEKSDIDLLIRPSKPLSLIELIGLERQLSDALGTKVEVVTERSLHRYIAPQVFQDLKPLYGER